MSTIQSDVLVLRDAEGNYYVRLPADQAAELEALAGSEDVSGFLLPASQPFVATPIMQLSSYRLTLAPSLPSLRAINPWLR
jgi:hypothetical protein